MAGNKVGRVARLLIDVGIFAFGSLLSKIVQFLLLPLYTGWMSPGEFGVAEIIFNLSQLLMPLATLSVANGVFRYAMDKIDRKTLLSSSLFVVLIGEIIVTIGACLTTLFKPFEYATFFCILLLGEALKSDFSSIVRGFGYSKRFAMGGPIDALLLALFNIVFIGFFHYGVAGYLTALVLANYLTALYYFLAGGLWRYLGVNGVDFGMIKALLRFSVPMVFNTAIFWFINMSGRFIILWNGGEDLAGCYIAASKLPAVINMAVTIFQQAWQISSTREIDSESRDSFYSTIFVHYFYFVLACSAFAAAICPFLADILLKNEFRKIGYILPLLLTIGSLNGISTFFGTFYNVFKQNMMITASSFTAAIFAVFGGYLLNFAWGPVGVALGGIVGFSVMVAMRVVDTRRRFVRVTCDALPIVALSILYVAQVVVGTMELFTASALIGAAQLMLILFWERRTIARLPVMIKNQMKSRRLGASE